MTRAEFINNISVVRGAGVGVPQHHCHGSPGGFPFKNTRKKGDSVGLFPGGGEI